MTETEQLKLNAAKQKALEQLEKLMKYLDDLFEALFKVERLRIKTSGYVTLSFVVYIAALVSSAVLPSDWADVNRSLATNLFWIVLFFDWAVVVPKYFSAKAEIRGCLNTLELLGMLEKVDGGKRGKVEKMKESKMEKVWAWMKQKSRDEAYVAA